MTPFLYAHQNRHAKVRGNGLRFHGYSSREVKPRIIGVHTTESVFDQIGEDVGAENVARYQSQVERPSSYHRIVDRDSTVVCLPDEAVAFGIGGLNSPALHLSFAMRAADWSDPVKAEAAAPTLERAAQVAAEWCRTYGIPALRIGKAQALAGALGFIAHGDADPGRRSDPGFGFPWAAFLARVQQLLDPPAPAPVLEDLMPTAAELAEALRPVIRQEVDAAVAFVLRGGPTHPDHLAAVRADIRALDVPRRPAAAPAMETP